MLNFTVGPVQMDEATRRLGAEQIPYFRTPEFSELMKENEALMKQFMHAGQDARAVFLTASGSGAMEAAVMNLFGKEDKLLVVDGGSFGHRFVKICEIHEIPFTRIGLEAGRGLKAEELVCYRDQGYTGFLVNVHETSTGVHYDMEMISRFCKENGLLLVVDSISSFLADEFDMEKLGVDIVLTGSQKALALPPGIGVLVISRRAVDRMENIPVKSLYFDLKDYLKNGERGQTPFTPAVSVLIQMNQRLKAIGEKGLEAETLRIKGLAEDFRDRIREENLPFTIASDSLSNAVTPLHPLHTQAYRVFEILKDEYGIFVCPNGGELAETVFRVGHIGDLTIEDNIKLVDALKDMRERGLL